MKRIISTVIAFFLLLTLVACGSPDSSDTPSGSSSNTNTVNPKDVTISETVLLDEGGVKITAKSFDPDSLFGPEIKVLIENNSDKDLTIQTRKSSVNGYMAETMFSADVVAGKKANDSITFMSSELEACGIETIADFEFAFHIFTTADWEPYLDSSMIQLKTSAADSYQYSFDDSGEIAYNDGGVKIVVKGLSEDASFMGSSILVYLENNSGRDITVQARDVSVNGFMLDPIFSSDVLNNKHAVSTITFLSDDLATNEITKIETVELSFHIFDYSDWDTIADTDIVTLTF